MCWKKTTLFLKTGTGQCNEILSILLLLKSDLRRIYELPRGDKIV